MTQKEFDWLQRLEQNVDAQWDELTVWEQRFIEDLLERFRRWGMKTKISPNENKAAEKWCDLYNK